MNNECLFCNIISGDLPSFKLWESEEILVFLDAFPVVPGHTLLIPKKHYKTIEEIKPDEMMWLKELPRIVHAVRTMVGAEGINVWQNNGASAGQRVDHLHFHLVPRFLGDKLFRYPAPQRLNHEEAVQLVDAFYLEG
jgi:histidine triad (HIT) family protein